MTQKQLPSTTLKISYCFVLLAAVLPMGLAKTAWVSMALGGSGFAVVPLLGPLVFLCVALYRIYLVVRVPDVLASPQATGLVAAMRSVGTFCIYVGVVASAAALVAGPLMRSMMTSRTESGAEFMVVGVYLSLVGGVGLLGLFLFEVSRLLAFERLVAARRKA
jgi:hypothetical protein